MHIYIYIYILICIYTHTYMNRSMLTMSYQSAEWTKCTWQLHTEFDALKPTTTPPISSNLLLIFAVRMSMGLFKQTPPICIWLSRDGLFDIAL